jgi:hypothetical protein
MEFTNSLARRGIGKSGKSGQGALVLPRRSNTSAPKPVLNTLSTRVRVSSLPWMAAGDPR